MKELRKARRFRRLLIAAFVLGAAWFASRKAIVWWSVSEAQGWTLALLSMVGVWILWRGLGLDRRARRRRRLLRHRLEDLDRLSGSAFEDWIATVLEASGYEVETTPRTGDYGVDLIVSKGGQRIGIEAKRLGRPISNRVVRSVVAGCQFHRCERAAIVTQSRFTDRAVTQAQRAEIEVVLVGRDDLHRVAELLIR